LALESTLGVGVNRRRLSVDGSVGEAGAWLIRRLGITPESVACTDGRSADGTHKKWAMEPSDATTSTTSSEVYGRPDRPSKAANA
jgi:hypothetical protein